MDERDLDGLSESAFEALLVGDVPMGMAVMSDELSKHQIVRPSEVMKRLGVSRATLYRLIKRGAFPRPRVISTRVTGWLATEIIAWVEARERTQPIG
jgi:prophage regulatory protein